MQAKVETYQARDNSGLQQKFMTQRQSRSGAMAQLDAANRYIESPKTSGSAGMNVEHLLRGEHNRLSGHTSSSPIIGRDHELEEDHLPPQKKSVLAKVKEKARKWRNTLSKKKNSEENATPSWGVSLEDDEDEDPEYLGAPMYESEMAPEGYKEAARQHPRAIPVIPEKHSFVVSNANSADVQKSTDNADKPVDKSVMTIQDTDKSSKTVTETAVSTEKPSKTLTETVTEKLAPAYATVSDATQAIASKLQSLTISTARTPPPVATKSVERSPGAPGHKGPVSMAAKQDAPGSAPAALDRIAQAQDGAAGVVPRDNSSSSDQIWDKGVSVKEYIMHKLEPGEDERALSQVISEAMSPRKAPGDVSVVEKVREAVTSLLRNEQSSERTVYHSAQSSSHIPISTNAHEAVEEESKGRILQAN